MGLEELFAGIAIAAESGAAEGAAVAVSEGVAAGVAEGAAVGVSEGVAAGVAEGAAVGVSEGVAAGVAEGVGAGAGEAVAASAAEVGVTEAAIAAEFAPLPEEALLSEAEVAAAMGQEEVIAQSVALEGAAANLAQAEASAAGAVGSSDIVDAALSAIEGALPGSRALFSALAEGKLNIPAMLQVLTAVLKLLSPLGPGIASFLKLHSITANKHIPAALATLQLMLGKITQTPTTKDHGIIFDVGSLKDALGAMGVRLSDEEDFGDVWLSEPIGNVMDRVWSETTEKQVAEWAKQGEADRQQAEDHHKADADARAADREMLAQGFGTTGELLNASNKSLQDLLVELVQGLSDIITRGVFPAAEVFMAWLSPILTAIIKLFAQVITEGVSIAEGPIESVIAPLFTNKLDQYRKAIIPEGEVGPGEQFSAAERMFGKAVEFGVYAHFLAAAAELCHPTKHIGLKQLAAGLADAAAFAPITRNTIGVETEIALGRPARWEANARTRSNLPDLGSWVDAYTRRFITWDDLVKRLRYEGWPEEMIQAYRDVPFRRPSVRELATVYEDVSIDEDQIVGILKHGGYHDDDIGTVLSGLRMRALKTFRSGYLSESMSAYAEGTLTSDGLDVGLDLLGVRDEGRRLVHQRADLARARHIHSLLLTQYKGLAKAGVFTLEDYRVALAGMGMDEDVAAAEVAVVDAYLREQVAKQEAADIKAGIRKMQQLTAETAEREVRLGIETPGEMESMLEQAGVEANQAQAMAILAGLKALPVPRLPVELSAEAAAQKVQDLQSVAILTLVRKRLMDGPIALVALIALGVEYEDATARVAVAVAMSQQAAPLPTPPKESAEVRQVRQIKTQEALATFRAGDSSEGELRASLTAAGNSGAVVDALVSREAAAATVKAEQDMEKLAAQLTAQAAKASQAGA